MCSPKLVAIFLCFLNVSTFGKKVVECVHHLGDVLIKENGAVEIKNGKEICFGRVVKTEGFSKKQGFHHDLTIFMGPCSRADVRNTQFHFRYYNLESQRSLGVGDIQMEFFSKLQSPKNCVKKFINSSLLRKIPE